MKSLSLSVEEFASSRRAAQDRLVSELRPFATAFVNDGDIENLLTAVAQAIVEEYEAETDAPLTDERLNPFLADIETMLGETTAESDPDTVALALSLAVLNQAVVLAAESDQTLILEWVTMADGNVRETHRLTSGQQRPVGEMFDVGDDKMPYPGWMGAPVAQWINCRCVLRPARANDFSGKIRAMGLRAMSDVSKNALGDLHPDPSARHQVRPSVTAAADYSQTVCIMALPDVDLPTVGDQEQHATLIYFGSDVDPFDVDQIKIWTEKIAADGQPFSAKVKTIEPLGPDDPDEGQALVWLLDESDLNGIHEGLMSSDAVRKTYEEADTTKYPEYTPHVTIGHDVPLGGDMMATLNSITDITFDRLAVWHGEDRTEYPLGASMDDVEKITEDEETVDAVEPSDEPLRDERVRWHGVLAPEGVWSGDGRRFATESLRHRDLPLNLTWQERSTEGHNDSITVASIDKIARLDDGNIHAAGWFMTSVEEADELIGLIAEMGKYGVSVDADDVGEMEFGEGEDQDKVTFNDARISGASAVQIPAFQEAYIMLGFHPVLDAEDWTPEEMPEETEEALVAALSADDLTPEKFADLAPGKTEDGPGWLTHPVDTDRLRDYWVRGPGAAKIGWGAPGDFNRCRLAVAEYVKPQHLSGYCANRHYDALGSWPGQNHSATAEEFAAKYPNATMAPAVTLVAAAAKVQEPRFPAAWFSEPDVPEGKSIVFGEGDEEGRVSGFIAEWETCHIGYDGVCTVAPSSLANYAYFATGEVLTDDGKTAAVGSLTFETGHADAKLAAGPAMAHYDNTGAVWADVAVGENERGIWFSGARRDTLSADQLRSIRASGRISGDWRRINGEFELVAGLTVNVPGFPIAPTRMGLVASVPVSLVAAGAHQPEQEQDEDNTLSIIAAKVVDEMENRQKRRAELAAIKSKRSK